MLVGRLYALMQEDARAQFEVEAYFQDLRSLSAEAWLRGKPVRLRLPWVPVMAHRGVRSPAKQAFLREWLWAATADSRLESRSHQK